MARGVWRFGLERLSTLKRCCSPSSACDSHAAPAMTWPTLRLTEEGRSGLIRGASRHDDWALRRPAWDRDGGQRSFIAAPHTCSSRSRLCCTHHTLTSLPLTSAARGLSSALSQLRLSPRERQQLVH
eukprot:3721934-Rhodomonas_salina.1